MGDLVVDLIPSMLGLLVTPAAIAGAILLLSTARPFANAMAFTAGFLLAYGIIAAIVVTVAAARSEPLLSARAKATVECVVGMVLLLLALTLIARRANRPRARRAKKSFAARLDEATPPFAFGAGLALAIINPNIPILVAGLAVVAASDTGHVLGAGLLVLAAISGMLIPILWRWLAPRSAPGRLDRVKTAISAHDRAINITVLLVFGTTFTMKGLIGL
ncbi:GAP family protein [Jiangella alkaliphila]|uniref:Sap, sulfolipid-1-addressing protein n=1 Tax=Jiangella alkaliphila TaxID=419479 RepID=A0A1H2LDN8_9ACTN|nr:GAP family protein [Jiangella alkaliphila]SDU78845.1 Sap, sulfolipid-1-addressing protein [Jiangella alkaliphila]